MNVRFSALRYYSSVCEQFVPVHQSVCESDVFKLQDFLLGRGRTLVITGAGVSTESGIPDYRSEAVGLYARTSHRPVLYQDFLRSPSIRQRYWARNYVGWPRFSSVTPNITHQQLVRLERAGYISHVVTQNVDALHRAAGQHRLTELHGCAHRVECVACGHVLSRHLLQSSMREDNETWSVGVSGALAPDGDIELSDEQVRGFSPPRCPECGGDVLKPEVVFFGDNVKRSVVEQVRGLVRESERVLCLGTSLHVYSAYRFVKQAHELDIPIATVNIGAGRADHLASVSIRARCGEVFEKIQLG